MFVQSIYNTKQSIDTHHIDLLFSLHFTIQYNTIQTLMTLPKEGRLVLWLLLLTIHILNDNVHINKLFL